MGNAVVQLLKKMAVTVGGCARWIMNGVTERRQLGRQTSTANLGSERGCLAGGRLHSAQLGALGGRRDLGHVHPKPLRFGHALVDECRHEGRGEVLGCFGSQCAAQNGC